LIPVRESKLQFRGDDAHIKNCFELMFKDSRFIFVASQTVQRDLWFMELKAQMKQFLLETMKKEDRKEQRSQHGFQPRLKEILADHELALFFRAFLHSVYNYENLTFWLQVEDYKTKSDKELSNSAKEIHQRYFTENSEYSINVSYKLKTKLEDDIKNPPNRNIFDELQKEVWKTLEEDCVPKFWNSEIFKEYLDNLDLENVKQPRIDRSDTTMYLASFVKKIMNQPPIPTNSTIPPPKSHSTNTTPTLTNTNPTSNSSDSTLTNPTSDPTTITNPTSNSSTSTTNTNSTSTSNPNTTSSDSLEKQNSELKSKEKKT